MTTASHSREDRQLAVEVASNDALDVRQFSVDERMSALFEVRLVVLSENPGLEFDAIVGQPAEHVTVGGSYRGHVTGEHSMIVGGDAHERIFGRYAMQADGEIHQKGKKVVIEVGEDFCIKGPGGFIRINAEGVIIKGATVRINSGGTATSGTGVQSTMPDSAGAAHVEEPMTPVPDDVSRTGIGQ
jgi:hypothetical protein